MLMSAVLASASRSCVRTLTASTRRLPRTVPVLATVPIRRTMSTAPSVDPELASGTCTPCSKKAIREQGIQRLERSEAESMLPSLAPGWTFSPQPWLTERAEPIPDALHKVYRFRNFAAATAFCNKVAEASEQQNHHPAILLEWGSVAVWWWSHALNGVCIRAASSRRSPAAAPQRLYHGGPHRQARRGRRGPQGVGRPPVRRRLFRPSASVVHV